jgi:hypothetical protein
MSRGFAAFLIVLGCFLGVIGMICTIIGLQQLPGRGVALLSAGLVIAVTGAVLLVAALAFHRRARKAGMTSAADGPTAMFVPNVAETHELDGAPYTVLYTPPVPGKHPRPSVLRISTPAATSRGEFHMAPETWFDRVCKRFALTTEIATGDPEFDAECYVRSDTPEFAAAYLADPVKRVAVLDLRRLGFPEVVLRDGTLTASWVGFNPGVHGQPELPADTAARLVILARNLPEHRPEFDHRVGAHRTTWQIALWVFLLAFALTMLSLIAYPLVNASDLLVPSLVVLFAGLPSFAFVAAFLLRGTSTSHRAWGGLMLGAVFLFPVGSFGSVALVNGGLDDSPAVDNRAEIIAKWTTKSKGTTRYHVRCTSWLAPGRTESFQVSAAEFNAVVPLKSHLVVTTHAGALGAEWMKSKRVAAQPPKAKP